VIYALIILQVLDIISTYLCLTSGKGYEYFGPMKWLQAKMGLLPALIAGKGVFIAMLLAWGHTVHLHALALLILFYLYIVLNNFTILRKK